jgi:cytochrome c biogenesis protein CcmG/thiol:disulfide interchange protein DsbE
MSQITETTAPQTKPLSTFWRVVALLAVVGLVVVLALGLRNRYATRPTSGLAPDFTMPFYAGYEGGLGKPQVTLSELRGKVVLVNFWASWCVECRDEQAVLEKLWRQYRDKGVVFLGIDYVDTEPAALQYLKEFGVTYPNGPDMGTKISPKYRITGVPESFLVDKQGNIVWLKIAPVAEQELAAQLSAALAK